MFDRLKSCFSNKMWVRTARSAAIVVAVAAATAVSPGVGLAYFGMLSSADGGVLGTGNWVLGGTTDIEWTVEQHEDGYWQYAYSFEHPRGETSHFILEVSATFTEDDIFDADGDFGNIEVSTFGSGGSNPGMPGSIYGIKFDNAQGLASEFSFSSWRAPVWGDFYAKNGSSGGFGSNAAWNAGFGSPDVDPTDAPSNGSIANHLLVPDTYSDIQPVPEPASLLLLGGGLFGLAMFRRFRR